MYQCIDTNRRKNESIEDSEKKQYYEKRNDLIQRLYNRIKDIIPAIAFDNKLSVEENFLFSRCFRKYVRKTLVQHKLTF